jgi:glutathione S-transferase
MFDLFLQTPDAAALMAPWPTLLAWWERMASRPFMRLTSRQTE